MVANHSTCRRHQAQLGAGEGIRTLNSQLGRLELYQLSYSRKSVTTLGCCHGVYMNWVINPSDIMSIGYVR